MTKQSTTSALDNALNELAHISPTDTTAAAAELAELKRRLKCALIELAKSDNVLGRAAVLEENIKELRADLAGAKKIIACLRAELESLKESYDFEALAEDREIP
jgi:predicted RNase H-like nuclease (RuvC/YqgF family)